MTEAKGHTMPEHSWLRKLTLWLAALLALIVLPLYAVKVERKTDYTDFEVYYRAATRARLGQWDQIYNLQDGASPFRYAPPLVPLFRPFAQLTLPQARMAWYFLQYLWFGLAFFLIERALRLTRIGQGRKRAQIPGHATWIAAAAFLFTLRFCLDCFTIGQVSSLLFLGYCAALYAWMARKPGSAGLALAVPSVFKIGPGFLFSFFAASHKRSERVRALGLPLLGILGATLFLRIWVASPAVFSGLWQDWVRIVANDSSYYDASHYGSQSVKSAILRAVRWNWLTPAHGYALYLACLVSGCIAVLAFWGSRKPRTPLARGLFFSLGVFPYLWFMPETFKYSLTALAIPVALLLACPRKDRPTWFALGFGALTLSVAGLDIVGKTIFFGMQYASVPLLATFFLGLATWQQASRQSAPVLPPEEKSLGPWEVLPASVPDRKLTIVLPLPLQSHSDLPIFHLRKIFEETGRFFSSRGDSFEILVVPFGDRISSYQPALMEAALLADTHTRILTAPKSFGRGAALRDAFLASRGEYLLAVNLEQPCELDFFARALDSLESGGATVVRANRRHPESRFRIPVKFLKLVYGRHRLGLLFNRIVRRLLPITTTDTHSGTWAMTRKAATTVFALQRTPGFLFDLELSLIAKAHGFTELDLPVHLYLAQEKSVKRIGRESLSILRGLPMLASRNRQGCYGPQAPNLAITADDWGLTPGVNQGILELSRLGIVKRVSMMAYSGFLQEGLQELKAIPGIRLGLHFDLTYAKAQPGQVLLKWVRPGGDRDALIREAKREFEAQMAILNAAGVKPDYLDGHHHIHLAPGLIDELAPLILASGIRQVRLPYDPGLITAKPALWLLAWFAKRSFRRNGFEPLRCFYPQSRHFLDQGLLRARLGADPESEVIVHPANRDDLGEHQIPDPYTSGRVTEYQALRMLGLGND